MKGEIYPCKADIFKKTYEVADRPETNADRIRAMSDEELEELLHATHLGWTEWCDYHCENRGDDGCDKCIAKWLKQPVG